MLYMRAYFQWAAAHRGSKARRRREAGATVVPTRSQRTPPSNTAIKTRVKTLEAC